MEVSLRSELGAHLRAARAAVAPEQVGLDGGGRRRTPGLRREEVAALAGVSLAWYTWLEQGRVQPSRQVVDAICTALRMSPDAHRHALSLAGFLPSVPLAENGRATISAETHELVHRFRDIPTLILDERFDIRAENAVHHRLWGDLTAIAPDRRNLLIWLASDLPPRRRVLDSQPLLRGLYEHLPRPATHPAIHGRRRSSGCLTSTGPRSLTGGGAARSRPFGRLRSR